MRHAAEDPLDRLADALDAFVEHRGGDSDESPHDLLSRRSELADLLGPMLADDEATAAEAGEVRIGPFRIVRELGRGGMGIVYEAVDESLDRRVALKLLPEELSMSPRRLARFRREAAIVAKLDHPGIVRVHQVGELDGRHFIAMELFSGESLEVRLEHVREAADGRPDQARTLLDDGSLPYALQVAHVCRDAARALAHAHRHEIVHRDVKPSNILFDADGRARLADFGLAFDAESVGLSRSDDLVGTPYYVSPEQLTTRGRGADPRMDVFALGVVLYEALTFVHPFDGDTTEEVMYAITFRDPLPPTRFNARIPRDLETVCLRALVKDPGRRYPTAQALADDLDHVLRREAIVARPAGWLERLWTAARRRPARAVATASLGALLVGVPLAGFLHLRLTHDAVVEEQQRTEMQRQAADENLDRVRGILDELMTEVADGTLIDDPEGQALRLQLLTAAARHHTDLAGESDDRALLLDAARAHGRLGRAANQLGEHDRALAAYSEALAFFARIEAESAVVRTDGAATQLRRALVHGDLGHEELAAGEFDEARAILRAIVDAGDDPLATFAARELAQGARRRAGQLRSAGHTESAGELLETARGYFDRWRRSPLVAEVGAPSSVRVESSLLDFETGELALARRQIDAAEAAFRRTRTALETLVAEGNGWAHTELPTVITREARIATARGDRERAAALEADAAARFDAAVARYPRSLELRQRQCQHLVTLGSRLVGSARRAEADELTRRALEIAEQLVAAARSRPAFVSLLGRAQTMRGAALRRSEQPDRAAVLEQFEASVASYEQLVERWPEVGAHRRELAGALSNCAEARFSLSPSEPDIAVHLLQRAIGLQQSVLDAQPGDAMADRYLRNHFRVLGRVALRLDDGGLLLEVARGMRGTSPEEPDRIVAATTWLLRSCTSPDVAENDAETRRADALAWLGEAVELGFAPDRLKLVDGLEVLAGYPEFRALTEDR